MFSRYENASEERRKTEQWRWGSRRSPKNDGRRKESNEVVSFVEISLDDRTRDVGKHGKEKLFNSSNVGTRAWFDKSKRAKKKESPTLPGRVTRRDVSLRILRKGINDSGSDLKIMGGEGSM